MTYALQSAQSEQNQPYNLKTQTLSYSRNENVSLLCIHFQVTISRTLLVLCCQHRVSAGSYSLAVYRDCTCSEVWCRQPMQRLSSRYRRCLPGKPAQQNVTTRPLQVSTTLGARSQCPEQKAQSFTSDAEVLTLRLAPRRKAKADFQSFEYFDKAMQHVTLTLNL